MYFVRHEYHYIYQKGATIMSQSGSWVRSLRYLLIAVVIVSGLSASSQPTSMQTHSTSAVAAFSATSDRTNILSRSSPSGTKVVASCLAQRCDGAKSIYGVSGSFDADSTAREIQRCLNNVRLCHNPYTPKDPIICPPNKSGRSICQICDEVVCPNGKVALSAVQSLGASLVRFGVKLACPPFTTGTYYWSLSEANADANYPNVATIVHQALFVDNLIPVIDFLFPNKCGYAPLQIGDAATEMQDFVHSVLGQYTRNVSVYFELGNEVNYYQKYYAQSPGVPRKCQLKQPFHCEAVFTGSHFNAVYAQGFAKEAQALQAAMSSESHNKYWILTGSVLAPEANTNSSICGPHASQDAQGGTFDNYSIAQDALNAALNAGVAPRHLGIAVHPYHYNTHDTSQWHDYYGPLAVAYHGGQVITGYGAEEIKRHLAGELGPVQIFGVENHYAGKCGDLDAMLKLWTQPIRYKRHQYQLPLVFTEDNWTVNNGAGAGAAKTPTEVQNYLDGAYLVDFMSWMNRWVRNHRDKPVRVIWYRGSDSGESGYNLGLYSPGGGEKGIDHFLSCHNSGIKRLEDIRRNTISADFRFLAGGGSC